MSAYDDGMDMARHFAELAEEEAAMRWEELRTREFVGQITDAERAELARMVEERDRAGSVRPVVLPGVTYKQVSASDPAPVPTSGGQDA